MSCWWWKEKEFTRSRGQEHKSTSAGDHPPPIRAAPARGPSGKPSRLVLSPCSCPRRKTQLGRSLGMLATNITAWPTSRSQDLFVRTPLQPAQLENEPGCITLRWVGCDGIRTRTYHFAQWTTSSDTRTRECTAGVQDLAAYETILSATFSNVRWRGLLSQFARRVRQGTTPSGLDTVVWVFGCRPRELLRRSGGMSRKYWDLATLRENVWFLPRLGPRT
jgi:hypothetical protein